MTFFGRYEYALVCGGNFNFIKETIEDLGIFEFWFRVKLFL